MTAEHDRETLDLLSWALSGRGDLSSKKLLDRVRAVMAARDEALAKVAEVETFAGVMAAYHRPDETRGGCICGFCAWSVEHVAIMSVRDAMDALAAGSSGALVVPAPRPAEEIRADLYRAATLIADGSDARDVLHMLAMDVEPLLSRLAAVERERDEARAANERLGLTAIEANRRAEAAERKVRAAELVHCWTNEDGKRFVFVDDLGVALEIPGFAAPVPPQPEPERCGHGRTDGHEYGDLYYNGHPMIRRWCPGPVSPQSTEETPSPNPMARLRASMPSPSPEQFRRERFGEWPPPEPPSRQGPS